MVKRIIQIPVQIQFGRVLNYFIRRIFFAICRNCLALSSERMPLQLSSIIKAASFNSLSNRTVSVLHISIIRLL